MYKEAFSSFRMGYGSTIATAMFFIVMTAGIIAIALRQRRPEEA
jgi:raffinose/stachyose/melibiose transport system permease protein